MAPNWGMPKARRSRLGALTNNPVFTTLLAAVVALITAFLVAHYQDQDAARQAVSAQRATAALQLETAATGFYQATFDLWPSCQKNPSVCLENSAYAGALETFRAAISNVSDPSASALAKQLINSSTNALTATGSSSLNDVGGDYGQLLNRCGQLVQGQQ
jgi:hypothetical protein